MKILNYTNKILFVCLCIYAITLFSDKTIINSSIVYLDKQSFIQTLAPLAVEDMKNTGVYASVTLGQAAIESGMGGDEIAFKYNNYFGMKAFGISPACTSSNLNSMSMGTGNQFWSGMAVCRPQSEGGYHWFRVYDSVENSIADHSRNLWCGVGGRYVTNGVFASPDPQTQLYNIARSGYAVDKDGNVTFIRGKRYDDYIYSTYIIANNWMQYDVGYKQVKPNYAETCTNATYTGNMPSISGIQSGNNAVNIFTTTYDGNIREGYIYARQKGISLTVTKKDTDETINNKVDNIINKIFNNTGKYSSGPANSGNYELIVPEGSRNALDWKQYDSNWSSIKLGSKGETIKGVGCLATSVAIQIKLSGTQINSENFNPGTWVQYLNGHGGFSGSLFNWSNSGWSGLVPNWEIVNSKVNLPASKEGKISTISSYLNQGYYPIMCVKKNCGHWVAVTGVTNDNIKIADPGSSTTTAWPKYQVSNTTRIAIFKKND